MSANPPTIPHAVISAVIAQRDSAGRWLEKTKTKLDRARSKVLDLEDAVGAAQIQVDTLNQFLLDHVSPDCAVPAAPATVEVLLLHRPSSATQPLSNEYMTLLDVAVARNGSEDAS